MIAQNENKACQIPVGDLNYYTVTGAANYLKISERTLNRLVNCRKITYMKHERGTLFLKEWLDERLQKQVIFSTRK